MRRRVDEPVAGVAVDALMYPGGVHAPVTARPPDARHAAERVAVHAGDGDAALLLPGELNDRAVVETFAEEAAVEVQVFRAGDDVGARVRRRPVDAPEAQVHAQFAGGALGLHVFERPERDHREIVDAAVASVQDIEFDAVEIDADAAGVAVVRGNLGCEEEPRGHHRHAGDRREEVAEGHRTGCEQLVAVPLPSAGADIRGARRVGAGDRRLDRVARRTHDRGLRGVACRRLGGVCDGALRGIGARGVGSGRRTLRAEGGQRRARSQ